MDLSSKHSIAISQRIALEVLSGTSRPPWKQRAQGRPGARCTRGLVCNVHKKCAHEHTGPAESIRPSLRNGFTAYNVISPVSHVLLPPSTPTSGASGPHVFAVRSHAARFRHSSVHRNPSLVGNDGRRPLSGTGCRIYSPVRLSVKAKYFLFWGLTQFLNTSKDLPAGSTYRGSSLISKGSTIS